MDIAFLVGIVLAFGAVIATVIMEGGNVNSLFLIPPMILVFGATLAVGFASATLKDSIAAFGSIPRVAMGKTVKPSAIIAQMVDIADKARKGGLLSLEGEANNTKDPFMRTALQNIADGTDSEELRVLLEDEIETRLKQNNILVKYFKAVGGYAPTIGIIGTVVALTHVLENLSNPAELGHQIASAFIATFWGLVSANFLWLPIAERLSRLSAIEIDNMRLVVEGTMAIQTGVQPRLLGERLQAMIPRTKDGKDGGKAKPAKGKSKDE